MIIICDRCLKIVEQKHFDNRCKQGTVGRPGHGWEYNARLYDQEIGVNARNWFDSGEGLLKCPCECGIEPLSSISYDVS